LPTRHRARAPLTRLYSWSREGNFARSSAFPTFAHLHSLVRQHVCRWRREALWCGKQKKKKRTYEHDSRSSTPTPHFQAMEQASTLCCTKLHSARLRTQTAIAYFGTEDEARTTIAHPSRRSCSATRLRHGDSLSFLSRVRPLRCQPPCGHCRSSRPRLASPPPTAKHSLITWLRIPQV